MTGFWSKQEESWIGAPCSSRNGREREICWFRFWSKVILVRSWSERVELAAEVERVRRQMRRSAECGMRGAEWWGRGGGGGGGGEWGGGWGVRSRRRGSCFLHGRQRRCVFISRSGAVGGKAVAMTPPTRLTG